MFTKGDSIAKIVFHGVAYDYDIGYLDYNTFDKASSSVCKNSTAILNASKDLPICNQHSFHGTDFSSLTSDTKRIILGGEFHDQSS